MCEYVRGEGWGVTFLGMITPTMSSTCTLHLCFRICYAIIESVDSISRDE